MDPYPEFGRLDSIDFYPADPQPGNLQINYLEQIQKLNSTQHYYHNMIR